MLVEESSGEEDDTDAGDKPIILAQADTSAAQQDWKYAEGTHFARMVPTQPTVGGADKIEVAEFFWYGCNHCFDFEPYINNWAGDIPANVRFVRVPALWNPLVRLHGQLYYTEEVLAENGVLKDRDGFRNAVFLEIHRRGNRLASEGAIQAVAGEVECLHPGGVEGLQHVCHASAERDGIDGGDDENRTSFRDRYLLCTGCLPGR